MLHIHQLKLCLDLDQLKKENVSDVKKKDVKKRATLDCKGSPILGRNKEWQKRICANSKLAHILPELETVTFVVYNYLT